MTWSISGANAGLFAISASGVLTVASMLARGQTYNLTVEVADASDSDTLAITVTVQANRLPVFDSGVTHFRIPNGSPIGTYVALVTATDPDSDAITYGLTGADIDHFTIDTNGRITTDRGIEDDTTYRFSVTANDGTGITVLPVTVQTYERVVGRADGDPQIRGLRQFRERFDVVTLAVVGGVQSVGTVKATTVEMIRQTSLQLTRPEFSDDLPEALNKVQIQPVIPIPEMEIDDIIFVHSGPADADPSGALPVEHFQIVGFATVGDNFTQIALCEGYPRPS